MELVQQILLIAPILLFSMVAHEYAHGYAAMKQGDPTASLLGRLTLNPIKHIDPFMTVIMPISLAIMGMPVFGGAKPVPVNPANYRNYRRGDIIVSLAGVATNFALAVLCVPLIMLAGLVGGAVSSLSGPAGTLQVMLMIGINTNLLLTIFNLLPIPPLDGSHVFKYLLPARLAVQYERIASAGFLVLMALLYFGRGHAPVWLTPVDSLARSAHGLYERSLQPSAGELVRRVFSR